MLVISEREEGEVVRRLPIELVKLTLGWSWYQDTNPVPTSFKFDGLTTTPLRLVEEQHDKWAFK